MVWGARGGDWVEVLPGGWWVGQRAEASEGLAPGGGWMMGRPAGTGTGRRQQGHNRTGGGPADG
jgi:hypothetical protein